LPDAAWLLGILLLKHQRPGDAEHHLSFALDHSQSLGSLFERFGVALTVTLGITPEVSAHLRPGEHGTLLALLEIYQRDHRLSEAMKCVDRLLSLDPSDPVVLLSFVELTLDDAGEQSAQKVVSLTSAVKNETPIHAAILLYKGRALMRLGLSEAAAATFTTALRPRKDRPQDLLRQICYERALAYDVLGRKADSRRQLERLYAEAPDFEDVGARLGLISDPPHPSP
jgi:tetratricopeptide (TPR) repeat protein